jgi:hypothetical protein
MAKGYRIQKIVRFPEKESYVIANQSNFIDMPLPNTEIHKTDLGLNANLETYLVRHEMIVQQIGRYKETTFNYFAAPFEINLFVKRSANLLLVQTKKPVAIDFIKKLNSCGDFEVNQCSVDFDILQPYVTNTRGAWFRFNQPDLRSMGQFGNHIDRSQTFQESVLTGELSALCILYDFHELPIPIQITSDGVIVTYSRVSNLDIELSIILDVYDMLNSIGALTVSNPKQRKHPKKPLSGEEQTKENPTLLFEILDENET